jgi:hypothetical protein
MVTKPDLGSTGWGQVLNAALDSLQADTDAKLSAGGGTVAGALTVTGALSTSSGTTATRAGANDTAFATRVSGDTQDRLQAQADGDLAWSSGSAVADTSLVRASAAQLRITPTANASASSSVGGALNVTNTSSTGAGLVVYSTQATPSGHLVVARANSATFNQSAVYAEYVGTSHAVSVNHQGTGAASSALNLASTNTAHSALGVSGAETGRGTIKVTHTGTGADGSASALSIDLAGTGTASQGIFITSTSGGTTGNLIEARNGGTGAVFNVSSTGVIGLGSGTGAPDTTLYRGAANRLQTDDTFRVGTAATIELGPAGDVNIYASGGNLQTDDYFVMPTGQSSGKFNIFAGTADALDIGTAGGGVAVAEGANARMGVATLVAGTVTVANTSVTATSRIFLTSQVDGGTPGWLRVSARTAATSFTITSSSAADTSQVGWIMFEPS